MTTSSDHSSAADGSTLVFTDVCVTLSGKQILHNVSGMARVGQTLAIMGPSGAGKSTLLNLLAGHVKINSGSITLNGQTVTRHMRRKISYVQQSDVFYPNLTLKESLTYTTMLRLPDKMPYDLKMRRMHETVDALELNKCMDTKIGGTFVTGLSGGERKRASIACELLTNPRIIILDEPTSGLDSAIAYSLISTLSKYASVHNKTVVTTIHQPSSQIFHMFTNVLLVMDGEMAYFGPGSKIVNFFADVGLHCEALYNPADFILEQVKSGPENMKKILAAADNLRRLDTWPAEMKPQNGRVHKISERSMQNGKTKHFSGVNNKSFDDSGVTATAMSISNSDADMSKITLESDNEVEIDSYVVEGLTWQTGFMTQFMTLTRRRLRQSVVPRLLSPVHIGILLFLCILAGLEWFQTERTENRAQDRLGILFFVTVQFGFQPVMEAIFCVYDEHGVFIRERASGIYRVSAFFCALMLAELPSTFAVVTIYTTIYYWMTGLMPEAANFFSFVGILLLSAFTAQSIGWMFGVIFLNRSLVVAAVEALMIAFLLIGGFYNTNLPVWFYWTRYVSFMYYTLGALSRIEFEYGSDLQCNPPPTTQFPDYCVNETSTFPGIEFLEMKNLTSIPLYADVIVLAGHIVVFRILTYVILRHYRPKE